VDVLNERDASAVTTLFYQGKMPWENGIPLKKQGCQTSSYAAYFCPDQSFVVAGYGKMPGYEHVFTDFLLSLAKKEYKRRPSYSSLGSGEG
jgi:hypothetical protein